MALLTTDIGIANTSREAQAFIPAIGNMVEYSGQNLWSFTRGIRIKPNPVTKLIEAYDPGINYKIGDFRSYNHTASEPQPLIDIVHPWGPGGTTTSIDGVIFPHLLNIKEAQYYSGATSSHYTLDFYNSAADRLAKTGRVHRFSFPITFTSWTIPAGHTLEDIGVTERAISPELITMTPVTVKEGIYYIDTYISDVGYNERIRFPNSYSTITMHEYQPPVMRATQSIAQGDLPTDVSPGGYPWSVTGSRLQLYTAATPIASSSDVPQANGGSLYNFFWTVILGDYNGDFYAAGISSITLRTYLDDGSMSYDQEIELNTNNLDPTTQREENGSITGSSFVYDNVWKVYYANAGTGAITYTGDYIPI